MARQPIHYGDTSASSHHGRTAYASSSPGKAILECLLALPLKAADSTRCSTLLNTARDTRKDALDIICTGSSAAAAGTHIVHLVALIADTHKKVALSHYQVLPKTYALSSQLSISLLLCPSAVPHDLSSTVLQTHQKLHAGECAECPVDLTHAYG